LASETAETPVARLEMALRTPGSRYAAGRRQYAPTKPSVQSCLRGAQRASSSVRLTIAPFSGERRQREATDAFVRPLRQLDRY
jgi:hypothetical protein